MLMENINGQDMDAHERVEYLIKQLGKNPNSFADAIGVPSSRYTTSFVVILDLTKRRLSLLLICLLKSVKFFLRLISSGYSLAKVKFS